jgi:hypothetical protein
MALGLPCDVVTEKLQHSFPQNYHRSHVKYLFHFHLRRGRPMTLTLFGEGCDVWPRHVRGPILRPSGCNTLSYTTIFNDIYGAYKVTRQKNF